MKDFFDLDWLARHQEFDAEVLGQAIKNTFERRQTTLPVETPVALTEKFSLNPVKQTQWSAFLHKGRLESDSLETVIDRIHRFLEPFCSGEEIDPSQTWSPEKGWNKNGE